MKRERFEADILLTGEFRYVRNISYRRMVEILRRLWGELERAYQQTGQARVEYRNLAARGNPHRIITVLNWQPIWGIEEFAEFKTLNFPDRDTVLIVKDIPMNTYGILETRLIENPAKLQNQLRPLIESERSRPDLPEA
ncbi:MAG: hypothetical protein HZC41_17930 [Chloroflexi bacterium]|nr:hypothetical protein [Chloroflexota bacterium]